MDSKEVERGWGGKIDFKLPQIRYDQLLKKGYCNLHKVNLPKGGVSVGSPSKSSHGNILYPKFIKHKVVVYCILLKPYQVCLQ